MEAALTGHRLEMTFTWFRLTGVEPWIDFRLVTSLLLTLLSSNTTIIYPNQPTGLGSFLCDDAEVGRFYFLASNNNLQPGAGLYQKYFSS